MPELPEVETTRRQLAPLAEGRRIAAVEIRESRLRWPVEETLPTHLGGAQVLRIGRRAKYLLFITDRGTALSHLGMSGRWSVVAPGTPPVRHDHLDLRLEDDSVLRYHDPRRFGAFLWGGEAPEEHPRLSGLGPDAWGGPPPAELGDHLWRTGRGRRVRLRDHLLDGRVVAGIGNIYASEAAYRAGIRPTLAAGRISRARYAELAVAVEAILSEAIERGGTTLRDFAGPDGRPGGYGEHRRVYGRAGEACERCGAAIRRRVFLARSLYYCPRCQS